MAGEIICLLNFMGWVWRGRALFIPKRGRLTSVPVWPVRYELINRTGAATHIVPSDILSRTATCHTGSIDSMCHNTFINVTVSSDCLLPV